jgi:hypothetical protein
MGYASAGVDPTRGRWMGLRASWIKPLAYGVSAAECSNCFCRTCTTLLHLSELYLAQ